METSNKFKENEPAADESNRVIDPIQLKSRSNFKYYIHDSVAECRLQLLGDLTQAQVTELNGCWETARTTLGNRRLALDVRGLTSSDNDGTNWLHQMAREGAVFIPESFLRVSLSEAGKSRMETVAAIKLSLFGRVLGVFGRNTQPESSQAALRNGAR